jgi:hypothetical protein
MENNLELSNDEKQMSLFTLNGINNESSVKIEYLGKINENKINDLLMDQCDIFKYTHGIIYKCNITDGHLMSTKKLPVYNMRIIYQLGFIRYFLLNLYIIFEIKTNIKSEKQLLNENICGKYTIEIHYEDKKIELDKINIDKFTEESLMVDKLKKIATNEKVTAILKELIKKYDDERTLKFNDYMADESIIKPNIDFETMQKYM